MTVKRILGFFVALALIAIAIVAEYSVGTHGFPDGHIAEVGRVLIPIDHAIAIAFGLLGVVTGILSAKYPAKLFGWGWWIALVAILAAMGLRSEFDDYLRTFLDYGQGG